MYGLYCASMLRCWHLVWMLVRTDHPCLGVGRHSMVFIKISCIEQSFNV
jgi:hypothetical protein